MPCRLNKRDVWQRFKLEGHAAGTRFAHRVAPCRQVQREEVLANMNPNEARFQERSEPGRMGDWNGDRPVVQPAAFFRARATAGFVWRGVLRGAEVFLAAGRANGAMEAASNSRSAVNQW
jgi:hypothetical protein